jgi:NAD-reducing hydrogenase large subunit
MALFGDEGNIAFYDGDLRVVDWAGHVVADGLKAEDYQEYMGEAVEPHSYLKSPYFKPRGYPNGIYRVGPLARLHVALQCGTPLADAELEEFRQEDRRSSFYFHYARLIEMLYSFERMQRLLTKEDILSDHVRAFASPNSLEGVGIGEAPRGTLLHHYQIDHNGLITKANLIIATGHNNLAMNRGVLQMARRFVRGDRLQEGMLNRVEAVIRAYDPCLSCSTHAVGHMPLHVQLLAPDGQVLDETVRG